MLRSGLKSTLIALIFGVVSTAVLLEVSLRIASHLGVITPAERLTEPISFYRDDEPAVGVWHPPNRSFLARADCFQVLYQSNSYGARDRERELRSEAPRAVVLGDSFVEGIGVEFGRRMTDLLEARSGFEHLNFGTAGNFSSIQEWKLYETLASRFDHDWVLIFAFPNNDFVENDPDKFWQPDRYRPYLRRVGDSYEVFYSIDLAEAKRRAETQLYWNHWYNAFYVYRLISFLDSQIRVRFAQGKTTEYGYIGYEQFDDEDLERLFYSYRRIRDAAGGRDVVVFTIPRLNDFLYFLDEGYPGRLPQRLQQFADSENHIQYYDLIPGFVDDWLAHGRRFADYFIPCDGHWSELGSAVAADVVLKSLSDLYRTSSRRSSPPGAGN